MPEAIRNKKFFRHGAQTMGIAVRNEGSKVNSNINVTPMVDVMLVLLIIFMVITPMLQNKVQIDMAKVDNATAMPDADKEDAIVVAITRDGGVFLGQNKSPSVSLAAWFATSWPTSPARRSMFAPMRARSTGRLKTPSTPCAPPAWTMWAC
jgi:biopolymer transport protein ExbD